MSGEKGKESKDKNGNENKNKHNPFLCPDCGERLVFQEGCQLCPFCGYSRCG